MSTFVVNFLGDPQRGFRGRVRHVGSGEEAVFASVTDLLLFFEEMAASTNCAHEPPETAPPRSAADPPDA